jgi:hypothetical protein
MYLSAELVRKRKHAQKKTKENLIVLKWKRWVFCPWGWWGMMALVIEVGTAAVLAMERRARTRLRTS